MNEIIYKLDKIYNVKKLLTSKNYKIKTVGFEGGGFACYFNSALQVFAPAFVNSELVHVEKKSKLITYLYDIYINGSIESRNNFYEDIFKDKYFEFLGSIIGDKYSWGDAMQIIDLIIRQIMIEYPKESEDLILFLREMHSRNMVSEYWRMIDLEASAKNPHNNLYNNLMEDLYGKLYCDDCDYGELLMPKFLHIHCQKTTWIFPENILIGEIKYRLSGIIVSTGNHATAFTLRDNIWYHINDKIITIKNDLFKNGLFNTEKYSYLILGLQYQLVDYANDNPIITFNEINKLQNK